VLDDPNGTKWSENATWQGFRRKPQSAQARRKNYVEPENICFQADDACIVSGSTVLQLLLQEMCAASFVLAHKTVASPRKPLALASGFTEATLFFKLFINKISTSVSHWWIICWEMLSRTN
jgi:hypothetical protein